MEDQLFEWRNEDFKEHMGGDNMALSPYFDFRDVDFLGYATRDLGAQSSLCKALYQEVSVGGEEKAIEWLLHHHERRWSLAIFVPWCDDRTWGILEHSEPARNWLLEAESLLETVLENYPRIASILNYTARELPILLGDDYHHWACLRVPGNNWKPVPLQYALDEDWIEPVSPEEENMLIDNTGSPLLLKLIQHKVLDTGVEFKPTKSVSACPRYNDPNFHRPAVLPIYKDIHDPLNANDVDLDLLLSMTFGLVVSGQFDYCIPQLQPTVPLMFNTIGRGIVRAKLHLDKDVDPIKLCKTVFGNQTPFTLPSYVQGALGWPRGGKTNKLVPEPRLRLAPLLAKLRDEILAGSQLPNELPPASPIPKPDSGSGFPQGPQTYTGSDLERETLFMPSYCPLGSPVPFEDDKPEFNLRQYEMAEHMYPETVDNLPDPSSSPSAERRCEKWREEYLQNNRVTGQSPLRVATRVDLEERMSAAEPQAAINNFSTQDELDSLNERALLSRDQWDSRNEEADLNKRLDESVLEEEQPNSQKKSARKEMQSMMRRLSVSMKKRLSF